MKTYPTKKKVIGKIKNNFKLSFELTEDYLQNNQNKQEKKKKTCQKSLKNSNTCSRFSHQLTKIVTKFPKLNSKLVNLGFNINLSF
ncbi:MAG: hypothetical protein Q8899_00305 [Weeping tea tree witches'-broom phytoplasma]|uniref:hypothetical protein n=1 Tax=Candidatus Phytoplasma melaleucae TaxID=2982630 RepID=UPI00293AB7B3|nr:hypothetical protein [Weeping tea tree witches'-broom phytoplasma]